MCVCMYVYICICVHGTTYTYTYINIYIYFIFKIPSFPSQNHSTPPASFWAPPLSANCVCLSTQLSCFRSPLSLVWGNHRAGSSVCCLPPVPAVPSQRSPFSIRPLLLCLGGSYSPNLWAVGHLLTHLWKSQTVVSEHTYAC